MNTEAKTDGKRERIEPKGIKLPRTTCWRPVSFFGENLVKRKARRVYEGRGGFPKARLGLIGKTAWVI